MNTTINQLLTIEEARSILRIGRNAMYNLAKDRSFPSIIISNKIRIPLDSLNKWIEQGTTANK